MPGEFSMGSHWLASDLGTQKFRYSSHHLFILFLVSAKIFNIYPRKGAVLPGSDADLIILNPNATTTISAKTHHSRIDTNVYEGWSMKVRYSYLLAQFVSPYLWIEIRMT